MENYFDKKIEILIDAYKDASSRSRSVFMIMNLATALCIIAFLNSYYFWSDAININKEKVKVIENILADKRVSHVDSKNDKSQTSKSIAPIDSTDIKYQTSFNESIFKELAYINMPIIGIRFFLFDLGLINAIAMVILSTWFFFCTRRESHIIDEIYSDLKMIVPVNEELSDYVFQGIVNQSVFNTTTGKDFEKTTKTGRLRTNKTARFLKYVLVYAPVISISVLLVRDFVLWINYSQDGIFDEFLACNIVVPFMALIYCIIQSFSTGENEESKKLKLIKIYGMNKGRRLKNKSDKNIQHAVTEN